MKKQETNSTNKVFEVEYKESDVEELRKLGVAEEELPKVGIKKYRRSRFITTPAESKIKITMWIDGDILQHFKNRSELPNSAPYQTQINNELRKIMEKDLEIDTNKVEDITKNKEFVRAVAEQLKELIAA
ncbi:MAG: BrnA antitoxin family protein [Pyrinomonadaceae bacterium]|jgi:uncharacterized protein (DUF4415 family)|nr:BrnA antitoxin family protein [Pyrinomonadaceae bacterium]